MQINYVAIIEAANRRKEQLQKIEAFIQHAPRMMHQATDLAAYMHHAYRLYADLDTEGRAMLPPGVSQSLGALATRVSAINGAVRDANGNGLSVLAKESGVDDSNPPTYADMAALMTRIHLNFGEVMCDNSEFEELASMVRRFGTAT